MRRLRPVAVGIALPLLLIALGYAACGGILPERFAINGPMLHQMLGIGGSHASEQTLAGFHVPDGFRVGLYASGIHNARMLRFSTQGDLLVSSPRAGRVLILLRDDDGDGRSDGTRTLLEGLDRPHGLDFHDGWLYVAEGSAVGRVRFDARARTTSGAYERVVEGLPSGGNHWTRTLGFGPDGWMYVSVGSSCNVCEEDDPRRAAMLRFRPDGSAGEIYATGLRNSVGFDWRPGTGELYATDNGRDLLGDDIPPCELDLVERGRFYGWPYAYGDRVPDPDFGDEAPEKVAESVAPAHGFRAHNAPLGMRFIRGAMLPAEYRGAALVALHGSWNRTVKDGYKVVSLHWRAGGIEERDFLTGFLRDGEVVGRPVDVAEGPDGALYVSDDYGDAIYRVVHGGLPAGGTEAGAGAGGHATAANAPALPADPDRGREIYASQACAGCHEPERAAPGTAVRPLVGLSARYDLAALTAFLAAPAPAMPPVELPAADRRDLAAYLLQHHP